MTAAEQLPDRLRMVLGTALGLDTADITIDKLRPLKRGTNRATWAFDAVTPFGRRPLKLHTSSPTPMRAGMGIQARIQAVAAARGVPIERIVAADDSAEALGTPYLISEMVKGVTDYVDIVGQLDSADGQAGRTRLLRQCALALAAVHRTTHVHDGPRVDRLEICRRGLDAPGEASATFEWAFRSLAAHRPPPSAAVLVHGDYRMGNLLVDGSDLTAVIEWEWAHVGQAYEDLAWFCIRAWRYGAPASLGAGGLGSIEDFLNAYEKASGTNVDRARFHWWLAMSTLHWGTRCRGQAQTWLTEKIPSIELALAGRRVCEIEWDLLNLLDGTQPGDDAGRGRPEEKPGNQTQPGDDAGQVAARAEGATRSEEGAGPVDPDVTTSVYGRPSAAELVAAVAAFLETKSGTWVRGARNAQAEMASAADVLRIVERELLDGSTDDGRPPARRGGQTAAELVAAVAQFLETTFGPAFSRKSKRPAKVSAAANALRTVERELLMGSIENVTQALANLGFADEAQLAAAIHNGDLDHRPHEVTSCLRALVDHRLAVAHPGYQNE